ncbi:multidrug effflux MFS transporter [Campylobacter helveticus]|uniref:Multidrug effflux MFS transporter n=1 Tax=Campylobacter helveticus TaxID=28898 RepID=A0AAX2UK32_9BACT|nr:multidrug effflux MFS transporter [Campylobacter helveticus]ARE79932.1 drug resistance transporter, Bcr/CflA family [Campylobacter helveticus]MCR2054232.1 multidrug effflux MFS transporter [Campylobacter helveticus]MCR2059706.1 multidrug effflux MFS transporter [Campylobacter helveticus]TNB58168.1 multidrug effflux MFS transporter [Campylobacter helveticus]TNB58307.1 multidrug effflux MFS transporter [Campylobacter helveticus]
MQKHTKIKGFAKFRLIVILALMSSIAPLSTDMYLPALSQVKQSFETSEFLTQLSIASFFIAFALGQLIYGPLSDVFGRKIPALVGIFLFMLSSLFCVIIDNIYIFIALRFFEALGGCAGVVIARAIVNDLFELKEAASIFALMMVFSALAPMLSPSLGGFLIEYFSWHSIFATLFGLGILLFLLILFALKESAPHLKRQKFSHKETLKSYHFVLKDKPFVLYVSCAALVLAAMFAYITGSSFVFISFFGLSEKDFGLLFGINALGFIIFANINAKIVKKIDSEKILFYALILMLISTLILFFNALIKPNFWLFEISIFTSIALLGFIAPNTTTLAMARFKDHSGTASAVLGTSQFALAGAISFIVSAVGANTPTILALVMLICVACANGLYFAMKR